MERSMKLVGKTSNEIFVLRYPASLLDFCDFDLSYFAKDSIDLCNEALKTGVPDYDRVAELRKEIQSAHCYIEHHIRTTYEKIVLDCWIDYVCRRDNIGPGVLWNRFIRCKTPFEKAVFARLCDFRYNRAINEWLNIVRVQDYAKAKRDFVFIDGIKSAEEAAARRNYFDLSFSVTARELGCRIEDLGVIKVFSVGRIPTAPFMFPNISKEIVRHILADFDYSDDYSDIADYSETSDQIAMDAFARMKAGLPQELSSYNIVRSKMENYPEKIFMPCSLKAVIDLEIDTIIENGAWLSRCKRCGRYFMRDKEHMEEYCSRFVPNGKTCLEIYEEENPRSKLTPELERKCDAVTDEIYLRVDKTMSAKEYEYWHSYLEAMKSKVDNGEISPEELDNFLNYSLNVDISKSRPIVEVAKREPEVPKERVVKPFVPERISRSEIRQPEPEPVSEQPRAPKEGFFTSPSVQRRKDERPQISHIIRGGESIGEEYTKNPDPAGFRPFAQPVDPPKPEPRQRNPYEDLKRLEEKLEEEKRLRRERSERSVYEERNTFKPFADPPQNGFREDFPREESQVRAVPPRPFSEENDVYYNNEAAVREKPAESYREPIGSPYDGDGDVPHERALSGRPGSQSDPERPEPPKPKVIRKNAAAISAYGRIAGTPVTAAPPEMEIVSTPAEPAQELEKFEDNSQRAAVSEEFVKNSPDPEPFKDIGSIFDVLEQSENDMSGGLRREFAPASERAEPEPEWTEHTSENSEEPNKTFQRRAPSKPPKEVTKENAPKGIWTEDRSLFSEQKAPPESEPSELDMLKEKKHGKSNKTRRLYDVIMREPDDNPNFRK